MCCPSVPWPSLASPNYPFSGVPQPTFLWLYFFREVVLHINFRVSDIWSHLKHISWGFPKVSVLLMALFPSFKHSWRFFHLFITPLDILMKTYSEEESRCAVSTTSLYSEVKLVLYHLNLFITNIIIIKDYYIPATIYWVLTHVLKTMLVCYTFFSCNSYK